MEEIQFLNYILSVMAVLVSSASLWLAWKLEQRHESEVKQLYDRIRALSDRYDNDKGKKR
jgi:hypothetical protein